MNKYFAQMSTKPVSTVVFGKNISPTMYRLYPHWMWCLYLDAWDYFNSKTFNWSKIV